MCDPTIMSSKSKRKAPRASVEVRVEYLLAGSPVVQFGCNVSRSGLFIKTDDPLPLGERIPITLGLPNHKEPVQLHCVVKRVVSTSDAGKPGMGIHFLFTDDAQRVSLFRLIDHVLIEQLGAELYQRLSGTSTTDTTSSMRALDSAMSTMSMESLDFD